MGIHVHQPIARWLPIKVRIHSQPDQLCPEGKSQLNRSWSCDAEHMPWETPATSVYGATRPNKADIFCKWWDPSRCAQVLIHVGRGYE